MCGLLRFLLERVQHMNGVGQSCNVDHTISSNAVADSNLAYAGTDRWHWLPVVRIKTLLDLVQRVAGLATRILWEVAQSIQGIAMKRYRLECHNTNLISFWI